MIAAIEENKVSIIVVNWNGARFLEHCLRALSSQTYGRYEIILVDNGSSDESVGSVKHSFPGVKLVELKKNTGFTGGNLTGFALAQGEFIALVNNDARVESNWLERIVQPMLDDSTIGICASTLIFEGTGRIDAVGDSLTTAGVGFNRGRGTVRSRKNSPELVFGACAAAGLYRRQMIEEIGFLDDAFFLYDEDTDLSFRAQLAGWKCAYVPSAVAYHKGNATSVRLSDTHVYYHTRNLEFVWIKNMPRGLMLRFAHHKILQELGSFCYLCLRHWKWRAFFRAKTDALKMAPLMLDKRKRIQARRRVSDKYIRGLMTSVFSPALICRKIIQLIRG